ncbi:MAG: dihydroorotate dehydrogenase electron transfer subunit [Clostridia bacterium]|nr:dihydroorotate dehydrogenase electron transfer subunit [Clostridia bacterium]
MQQAFFEIEEQSRLTDSVYRMVLRGDTSGVRAPGQFVNIRIEGTFLRRPISVCDCEPDRLTLIYKVVGKGTAILKGLPVSSKLDILTGLGNGYDLTPAGNTPLLIGGGVGVPPLYLLCKRLIARGARPTVILGFNTASEIFYEKEFRSLGADVTVTTVDGSYGTKGFVTAAMDGIPCSYFYTCGPLPMLKSVYRGTTVSGQFSLEERMGCGFGACMGCTCHTNSGDKRVCREGPVFTKEDLPWED